jgi:hypothetical protein
VLDDLTDGPELIKARKERDAYKHAAHLAHEELEKVRKRLQIHEHLSKSPIVAPKWAAPKTGKKRQATALLMLSDLHLDEVVKPEEMHGLNAFNRDIALLRLRKVTDQSIVVARDLLAGFKYDGAVLLLGGDIFTGIIHEELRETNEAPILASLEFWLDPLAATIETLAGEFGHLLVVGVVGNHGRLSVKWKYKGAVEDNFDWFLYRQLARNFRSDRRITWNIPSSLDAYFDLYGHRHLLTHGNQARGGSGISGLMTPLALFDHRKRKRDAATIGAASHTWLGHFHQYLPMGQMTVNGSLKGLDEYAYGSNFGYEPAIQAFAAITPEHNVTAQMAIYAEDREAEGW